MLLLVLPAVAALLLVGVCAPLLAPRAAGRLLVYGASAALVGAHACRGRLPADHGRRFFGRARAAARAAVDRRTFPRRRAVRRSSWSWSISAAPRRASTRSATAGTSRRRSACCRSIRLFLAGMNLVVLADDAFTFLRRLGVHVAGLLGAGDGAPPRAPTMSAPATSTS